MVACSLKATQSNFWDVLKWKNTLSKENLSQYMLFEAGCSYRFHWNACAVTSKQTALHGKHQSLMSFMRIFCDGLCFLYQSLKMSGLCSQQAAKEAFS